MILVTVGTHPQGFERLVRAADELAARLEEEMVIQYGSSSYLPRFAARSFDFTSSEEMKRLMKQARIIISHAAAGTIITALLLEKPLILVPRSKKYKESLDDHQIQLTSILHDENRAIKILDPQIETLSNAIRIIPELSIQPRKPNSLLFYIRQKLIDWEKR